MFNEVRGPQSGALDDQLCGRAYIMINVDPSPKKSFTRTWRGKNNLNKNFNSDQKFYIQNFGLQERNMIATLAILYLDLDSFCSS